jgi:Type II secretion system (T2SS), protein M subtype b
MGDLVRMRKRFMLGATILAVINLVQLVYLLWPGPTQPSRDILQQEYYNLSREVALWEKSNPEKTRAELKQLYAENLPERWSQISQQVDKLIRDTGVTAQSIHYPTENAEKPALPDVQQVKIETTVTGDYSKVARFINALEQDKLLFIIEKISLNGQEGGAVVSLQITFDTFLKVQA